MVLPAEENITSTTNEMHVVGKASSEASNSEGDLVDGLGDDIVWAQRVPRVRRNFPAFEFSWVTGNSPLKCDRVYNLDTILSILSSGGFIVFRGLYRGFHNSLTDDDTGLWVWNPFLGLTSMLPIPPLCFKPSGKQMFVCDSDCVYVLVAGTDTEEQDVQRHVYHVWMLNVRDFNLGWEELPSLPRLGSDVVAINYMGDSYICQRSDRFSWEADGIWKLLASGEIDRKWYWQHIDTNTPPPKSLIFDTLDSLPSYIEIIHLSEDMVRVSTRSLYARLSISYQSPDYIFLGVPEYVAGIFVIPSGDGSGGSESRAAIHDEVYYMGVVQNARGGLYLRKLDFYKERTRTVEAGEWIDFAEDWHDTLQNHKQRSARAIKLFRGWDPCKIQHRLNLELKDEAPRMSFNSIKVAHFGPIYAYQLIGEKGLRWNGILE